MRSTTFTDALSQRQRSSQTVPPSAYVLSGLLRAYATTSILLAAGSRYAPLRLIFGDLAQLAMLDTSVSQQSTVWEWVKPRGCNAALDPSKTMLGGNRNAGCLAAIDRAETRWNNDPSAGTDGGDHKERTRARCSGMTPGPGIPRTEPHFLSHCEP